MTVIAERSKQVEEKQSQSRRWSSKSRNNLPRTDEREGGDSTNRGPPALRGRRDRVSPESPLNMSKHGEAVVEKKAKRRSSSKKMLEVDTKLDSDEDNNDTPRTEATTPASDTPSSARGNSDLRSPGQRKTPTAVRVADPSLVPVPDFITQTDKYGNAITPRSPNAIQQARIEHPTGAQPHLHVGTDGKLHEEREAAIDLSSSRSVNNVDACAETLLDSFRIMCCCLLSDDPSSQSHQQQRLRLVTSSEIKASAVAEQKIDDKPRLLPAIHPDDHGKKCLVLDLDETLVHSSFRAVPGADFVIPVQIEDVVHFVYVAKRPGVDEFLIEMAKHYEIVVYTASLNKYADPLLDLLDPNRVIRTRLFRESCVYYAGNYVKDLSLLDRDLAHAIIVDNSPSSYSFHPENAIDCTSFIDDPSDRELDQIAAFLTGIKDVKDVRGICHQWREWPDISISGRQ